ncbi:MAG TPA: NADPH-dependent F420 reductase [bacterium]|jgi:hypothetical protein
MKIAVIGGTGALGTAFAKRLASAGYDVLIGSRDAGKAAAAAGKLDRARVRGLRNDDAASAAETILLTIPYAAHRATVVALAGTAAGKVVIDPTVPLLGVRPVQIAPVEEGSAAERTQAMLPQARVVSAFHTISAGALAGDARIVPGDVLLCGDDAEARTTVAAMIGAIGLVPVDAGALAWSQTLEHLGALMIELNRRYKRHHAGVRITGLGIRD